MSMAFFQYRNILLLVISTLILKQTHLVVGAANGWLAQAECHNARVPETCMQCLNSDHRTAIVENPAGVATIVVGCINSHTDHLVQEMTQLAASNHDQAPATPLEECRQMLACVKEEVIAADEKIHHRDFEGADESMESAYTYVAQCYQKIDEACQQSEMEISEMVMNEMRVHEQLCEAAMRIIEQCK